MAAGLSQPIHYGLLSLKKLLEGTTPEPRKISALMVKKINDELTSIAALGEPTKGNP